MDQGEGTSSYPWTPEDTERIYNEHEEALNQMRETIKSL